MEYPEHLPPIPIANDLATCINCNYVWLEFGEPDYNHCGPMIDPEYRLSTLTAKQREEYLSINTVAECPLYSPKK